MLLVARLLVNLDMSIRLNIRNYQDRKKRIVSALILSYQMLKITIDALNRLPLTHLQASHVPARSVVNSLLHKSAWQRTFSN